VLFLSRASFFAPGKPIRGGIPICFPWFGPRAGHAEFPAHGFARIRRWDVESLSGSASEGVTVLLRLASDDQTRALWPHDFEARLKVAVTRELSVTLEVTNRGDASFTFEEALHTYLAVSDVREVSVDGLAGAPYLDKTDGFRRKELGAKPLRFDAETDRVFPGTDTTCVINDPALSRRIVIGKSGSRSTVVWNPWIAKAVAMADFADDEWPQMLCIETANVGADAITLSPGDSHEMNATIGVA
jgi:D-hexose-6-phosphate mutarotase